MATLSIGDAVGAGFDVIRRRPLSVLAWGLAYLVFAVLPTAGLLALIGHDFVDYIRQAAALPDGEEPDVQSLMRLHAMMTAFQPVVYLAALAGKAMLTAAVFRAVLQPEKRGFFYMRLGKDELWQALIYLVLSILLCFALLIAVLLAGGLGALIWGAGGLAPSPWAGVIRAVGIAVAVLAALGAVAWVALRLSLAAPMTFADRTFRLFESWTATRGQDWRLFGLAMLLLVVILAIETAFGVIAWSALLGFGFDGGFDADRIEAFFKQPVESWTAALLPAAAVIAVIGSLFTGAVYVIFTAPWAVAYRQLGGAQTVEA